MNFLSNNISVSLHLTIYYVSSGFFVRSVTSVQHVQSLESTVGCLVAYNFLSGPIYPVHVTKGGRKCSRRHHIFFISSQCSLFDLYTALTIFTFPLCLLIYVTIFFHFAFTNLCPYHRHVVSKAN